MKIFHLGGDHADELRALGAEPVTAAAWIGDQCKLAAECDAVLIDDTAGALGRVALQCLLDCTEKPRVVAVQPGVPWGKYTGASLLVSREFRADWHIYCESLAVLEGEHVTRHGRYGTTTEPAVSLAGLVVGQWGVTL